MKESVLGAIQEVIQEDVGGRGLRTDPVHNLINACPNDFDRACRSIAKTQDPSIAIITGFYIPHGRPPCGETDGPLGALFMARALVPLGIRVALVTASFAAQALTAGLQACSLERDVSVLIMPSRGHLWDTYLHDDWQRGFQDRFALTHLVALERVGPSHTPQSIRLQPGVTAAALERFANEVQPDHHDRCHTMRGVDVTQHMAPAHLLVEAAARQSPPITTIGIGDGGNEIGMGKISWDIIRRNIPRGGLVACRVPTDYVVVCGVSNWGAYGLATGVRLLRKAPHDAELFDLKRERGLLQLMVEQGPLVDGTSGEQVAMVDGLSFERYAEPLRRMGELTAVMR
jgi:hypothetical protein